jgi:hypothetical protein
VSGGKLYYRSRHVSGADGREPWLAVPPDRPLVFDIFVDAVAGKNTGDFITPREAARVCAVQEALALGARQRRWVEPDRLDGSSVVPARTTTSSENGQQPYTKGGIHGRQIGVATG